MAEPTPYTISYSFAGFQANEPAEPLPATQVDTQFEDIETSIGEVIAALQDIRNSDGSLKAGIVTIESLDSGVIAGIPEPSAWVTATAYTVNDFVFSGPGLYRCLVAHTSGTFATDLGAGKWELLSDFTPDEVVTAITVTYDNAGSGLTAEDVQNAIDEIVERVEDLEAPAAVALADLAADVTIKLANAGEMKMFAGAVAPTGWLLCFGQAISRTTYTDLFSAIGTVWGVGDGSTTFQVPDMRGRVGVGKDNMGGTSADRLTNLTGGIDGDTLGAVGGAESHVLTSAQLASHTHSASTSSDGLHGHPFRTAQTGGSSIAGGLIVDETAQVNRAAFTGTPSATIGQQIGGAGAHTHTVSVGTAGSNAAHNNVQPSAVVNFIIFAGV